MNKALHASIKDFLISDIPFKFIDYPHTHARTRARTHAHSHTRARARTHAQTHTHTAYLKVHAVSIPCVYKDTTEVVVLSQWLQPPSLCALRLLLLTSLQQNGFRINWLFL